jgi:mycothione reductase
VSAGGGSGDGWHDGRMADFDLCLIGSGSANSIPDDRFSDQRIALVEAGTFGGTCLNVGCIPTKMFVVPADLARSPSESGHLGIDLELRRVHWPEIRDRIFGRIDPISAAGERYRAEADNITLFRRRAHFVGPHRLDVGDDTVITADRFVIAAGSRVNLPEIPGLKSVPFHTSDTVMRMAELPESMIILGGGYVAAEFAHVFSSFGTRVTVINRSGRLLGREDVDVSARFTEQLSRYVDVHLSHRVERVTDDGAGGVAVHSRDDDDHPHRTTADVLLVATGRVSNADTLDLAATGVRVDADGFVVVDAQQRTTAEGIFALGDVSSHLQLKHVANHEARVVQHNLLHPDAMIASDHRFVPHAVFSDPQVASVGLTEQQAREQGRRFVTAIQDYGSVAYGWALEDTSHFVKLLADPDDGRLLGAHLVGPMASSLIQPLIQAMSFDLDVHTMARGQYWIHPALIEVVENALLALPLSGPNE